jgi:hypothetical protein
MCIHMFLFRKTGLGRIGVCVVQIAKCGRKLVSSQFNLIKHSQLISQIPKKARTLRVELDLLVPTLTMRGDHSRSHWRTRLAGCGAMLLGPVYFVGLQLKCHHMLSLATTCGETWHSPVLLSTATRLDSKLLRLLDAQKHSFDLVGWCTMPAHDSHD